MKVCWICLCFNEIDILPFASGYWERIADKVIVMDNGSNDGSIEYLQGLPYVEIRHFESNGQNDAIQKQVKEQAYLEFKDSYDIIIIGDMDEFFYFKDFKAVGQRMIDEGYNCMVVPIYSLTEDFRPIPEKDKLLHQVCHKFYKQRMNHMNGFEEVSKISIFNTKITDSIQMSVGQHYVYTSPRMMVMMSFDGFCLHVDKGFGLDYKWQIRQKMNKNLSDDNRRNGLCIEYSNDFETLKKEYEGNIKKSFDINKKISF